MNKQTLAILIVLLLIIVAKPVATYCAREFDMWCNSHPEQPYASTKQK